MRAPSSVHANHAKDAGEFHRTPTYAASSADRLRATRVRANAKHNRVSAQNSLSHPLPVANLGHVFAVPANILAVLDELVAEALAQVAGLSAQRRHQVDRSFSQVIPIEVV